VSDLLVLDFPRLGMALVAINDILSGAKKIEIIPKGTSCELWVSGEKNQLKICQEKLTVHSGVKSKLLEDMHQDLMSVLYHTENNEIKDFLVVLECHGMVGLLGPMDEMLKAGAQTVDFRRPRQENALATCLFTGSASLLPIVEKQRAHWNDGGVLTTIVEKPHDRLRSFFSMEAKL